MFAVYQGPALESLWQQCCSDCALVRSACCDAMVLLVEQGHADLQYILNSVLNLLPSARYVKYTALDKNPYTEFISSTLWVLLDK